jgi:hypothetical protein
MNLPALVFRAAGGRGAALLAAAVLLALGALGCRSSYYAVMETFGKHKRELLRDALTAARTENEEATQQVKDALTQLRELTGFEGGDLEKKYNAFRADYEGCADQARTLQGRIRKVEQVADDLFAEWEKETGQITSADLRQRSRAKLTETRNRYRQVHDALVRSEKGLEPVLTQMKDYTLYLKHNLNAQALGSLKDEALNIEKDINRLLNDMNRSIKETETFLSVLGES